MCPCSRQQAGIGLVEVMLAVLIGSIGMLGLAAGQLAAGRALEDARYQSRATLLAVDMHTRLQANPEHRDLYLVPVLGGNASAPAAGDCRAVRCSPDELARFDLRQWFDRLVEPEMEVPDVQPTAPIGWQACLREQGRRLIVLLSWQGRGEGVGSMPEAGCTAPQADASGELRSLQLVSWGEAP